MSWLILAARVTLAAIFTAAALAKLFNLQGTRQSLIDFGVASRLAGPASIALPVAELVLAVALLPLTTARGAALAAALVLTVFSLAIIRSIYMGKRVICNCFGASSSKPAGWASVWRNGFLIFLALFAYVGSPGASIADAASLISDPALMRPTVLVVLVVNALLVAGFLKLLRQYGTLLLRIDKLEATTSGGGAIVGARGNSIHTQPPIGMAVPELRLESLDGVEVSLESDFWTNQDTLLVFMDPACGPCVGLLPDVEVWSHDSTVSYRTIVITRGDREANQLKFAETRLKDLLIDPDLQLSKALSTLPTPSAVVIGRNSKVASRVALGAPAIRELAEQSRGRRGNEASAVV